MRLSQIINEVYNGTIVLPEFQRSFVWEPEDIRELLVSILGGYFIGSMLFLELAQGDSPFALRMIEGVTELNNNARIQNIIKILLDGQQRTTALFYALFEPNLPLKNRKGAYKFYLNLERALEINLDEAVIVANINNRKMIDNIKKDENIIPFKTLMNINELALQFANNERLGQIIELATNFQNYEIHTINLQNNIELEKIVETFERINRTGEPLSNFDLLTARLYNHGIKLRDLLETAKENYRFIEIIPAEFILKVITLIRGREPKRKNILELDPNNFVEDWEKACNALKSAYMRVIDIRNGYGVLDFKKWMPYSTMIVPLAAMIEFINQNNILATSENYNKIDRWYWVSVFSNRYDQAVDSTSANDFNTIKEWIINQKIPNFIKEFNPDEIDLDISKQSNAIYRGVMNLILLEGALDFSTGQPPQFNIENVQDDHIFPKSIYHDDCILNRTLISTNAKKSNKKPSEYFSYLLQENTIEKLRDILKTHMISHEALECLLADNIDEFKNCRKQTIINNLKKKLQD